MPKAGPSARPPDFQCPVIPQSGLKWARLRHMYGKSSCHWCLFTVSDNSRFGHVLLMMKEGLRGKLGPPQRGTGGRRTPENTALPISSHLTSSFCFISLFCRFFPPLFYYSISIIFVFSLLYFCPVLFSRFHFSVLWPFVRIFIHPKLVCWLQYVISLQNYVPKDPWSSLSNVLLPHLSHCSSQKAWGDTRPLSFYSTPYPIHLQISWGLSLKYPWMQSRFSTF